MEQAADLLLGRELVVQTDRVLGRQDVGRDTPVLQQLEGLGADLQAREHTLREHHHLCAVLEQLLNIGRETARGLPPVE